MINAMKRDKSRFIGAFPHRIFVIYIKTRPVKNLYV